MRYVLFTLIILLTLSNAVAQENKPQDQKPTSATTTESEKPKNEVEKMLEDAVKRGDTIIGTCITEDCVKKSTDIVAGIETGRIIQMPKPPYPNLARMARAEGTVDVHVIIDEEGKVIAAAATSGHPLLFGVSVAAAREAVFTPTLLHGKPVKITGVIKYNFVSQ